MQSLLQSQKPRWQQWKVTIPIPFLLSPWKSLFVATLWKTVPIFCFFGFKSPCSIFLKKNRGFCSSIWKNAGQGLARLGLAWFGLLHLAGDFQLRQVGWFRSLKVKKSIIPHMEFSCNNPPEEFDIISLPPSSPLDVCVSLLGGHVKTLDSSAVPPVRFFSYLGVEVIPATRETKQHIKLWIKNYHLLKGFKGFLEDSWFLGELT